MRRAIWVGILLSGLWSQSPATEPATAASAPASAPTSTSTAESATHAKLRQTHLSRLYERLSVAPEVLQHQCRFESDISTAPPKGLVALTFDDGPDPERTEQILAVLDHYQVPATFFFIGEKMEKYPELVAKVEATKRHLIGSHSWSHPNFHDIAEGEQRSDLLRGLGQMPATRQLKVFRYPYGNSSCVGNDLLHEQGYRIIGWHVDSCDWAFDRTGSVDAHEALSCGVGSQYRSDFVGHVAAAVRARRGGIVLMHEIHANTLAKLADVIEEIRKDGFDFTLVDDPRLAGSLR
ncbi:polysaccharide deacetylase family protein [Burkholderiaceae bacterium UC74_6]